MGVVFFWEDPTSFGRMVFVIQYSSRDIVSNLCFTKRLVKACKGEKSNVGPLPAH